MGVQTKFSKQVTGAVRAELARRGIDGVALAAPLGLNRNSVYARLREERPFNTDELAAVAAFLDMSVDTLLASAVVGESHSEAVAS